jgi:hypothetical protein
MLVQQLSRSHQEVMHFNSRRESTLRVAASLVIDVIKSRTISY